MNRTTNRICKVCEVPLRGRRDKVYCSTSCKNAYHIDLRKETVLAVAEIDKILHRNYAILTEVLGKNVKAKVSRRILDKKKFNAKYFTSIYVNSQNKTYFIVYDCGWMEFTDGEILIIRRK